MTVGSTLPLRPTAIGRMLLSGLPDVERNELIKQLDEQDSDELLQTTDNLFVDELDKIAQEGLAVVEGGYEKGICGLAVGVESAGQIRAVLGTTVPMSSTDLRKRTDDAIGVLQLAAVNLGRLSVLDNW